MKKYKTLKIEDVNRLIECLRNDETYLKYEAIVKKKLEDPNNFQKKQMKSLLKKLKQGIADPKLSENRKFKRFVEKIHKGPIQKLKEGRNFK